MVCTNKDDGVLSHNVVRGPVVALQVRERIRARTSRETIGRLQAAVYFPPGGVPHVSVGRRLEALRVRGRTRSGKSRANSRLDFRNVGLLVVHAQIRSHARRTSVEVHVPVSCIIAAGKGATAKTGCLARARHTVVV